MDVVGASVGLAVTSPMMAVVAVLIRFKLGRPVIFRQTRDGMNERPFEIYKFRTMQDCRDDAGRLLPDGNRLTRLGNVLRASSLDELPEFWNVLKGDMSLVGPRPLVPRYTPFMTEVERARFKVRPGITGLAQVNGRNDAAWTTRLAHDAWYVKNWSLSLDVKILGLTLLRVIRRKGVAVDPGALMLDLDEERKGR